MSNETQWTPGPWCVHTHAERHGPDEKFYWVVSNEDQPCDYIACSDGDVGIDVDRALADAHLIAAAPELYGALAMMVEMVERDGFGEDAVLDCAIAALAKARGEQP